ncbi:putative transport protein [Pseudooceanicola batsensis HTCC2597]|uniref:Membrane fusion protein (MFP) family protein n=1 Tax=Pseudooceanicola batsensis (strain ATCC BAA-863 / DSM 15984 / KCTC 12145 / HTCC2597) TaxID=252305 RepID=A3TYK3_PSEBH|nr:HlyD family type I secretion periplasmic adaptor subunit [Pseudooceanicola batsensis]EAQ03237.1 putative transport protein [Pseudooceanicola batsensis HTCC2597]
MSDQAGLADIDDWYAAVPRSIARQATIGLLLMAITFGGFGAWAFLAPLAAAVISQGSFVAIGQNKIVQHLEGGIIKDILVDEGDQVQAGQLLLRLDETKALANERELVLRLSRLEAIEARLLALYDGKERLTFPPHLIEQSERAEIRQILAGQQTAFDSATEGLQNEIALLERNRAALAVRSAGYEAQLASHNEQVELLEEEFAARDILLGKGLMRRAEMTALKRTLVEAAGQIGRLEAEIGEIEQLSHKYEMQIAQTVRQHQQSALDDLQPIQGELDSIREQLAAARNVRERTDVIAPVSGTVVRLHYHTAGGVIESGRAIAEILPSEQPLIIEVQVPRVDIDSVRKGQHATIRLTALNRRTTPILYGKVIYVSADSVTDTQNGNTQEVYIARISMPVTELRRVANFTPTPGMPAEIMIQTAERTFAQYIVKPIRDSLGRAFREQ